MRVSPACVPDRAARTAAGSGSLSNSVRSVLQASFHDSAPLPESSIKISPVTLFCKSRQHPARGDDGKGVPMAKRRKARIEQDEAVRLFAARLREVRRSR